MKKVIALLSVLAAAGCLFAQTSALSDPNPEIIGHDSAMLSLREVSLDKFEREGSWNVHISPDFGVISGRLFEGNPSMKEPLAGEEDKTDAHGGVAWLGSGERRYDPRLLARRAAGVRGVRETPLSVDDRLLRADARRAAADRRR